MSQQVVELDLGDNLVPVGLRDVAMTSAGYSVLMCGIRDKIGAIFSNHELTVLVAIVVFNFEVPCCACCFHWHPVYFGSAFWLLYRRKLAIPGSATKRYHFLSASRLATLGSFSQGVALLTVSRNIYYTKRRHLQREWRFHCQIQ